MAKPDLRKLVKLRRQKAEADHAALLLDIRAQERQIESLRTELRADDTAAGYEASSLARQHGHARRLQALIDKAMAALVEKQADLETARHALKKALDSEERLKKGVQGQ